MSWVVLATLLLVTLAVVASGKRCLRFCDRSGCSRICFPLDFPERLKTTTENAFKRENWEQLAERFEEDVNENNEKRNNDNIREEEVDKRFFSDHLEENVARAVDEYDDDLE